MRPIITNMKTFYSFIALTSVLLLTACGANTEAKYPTGANRAATGGNNNIYNESQSIFGEGGLELFSSKDKSNSDSGVGLGVNALLWRATLDAINFMPITTADPFGGTIITDWYSNADAPNERFKVNAYILGQELRADNVKARIFRQTKSGSNWVDAPSDDAANRQLEDAILTRARELRVASLKKDK